MEAKVMQASGQRSDIVRVFRVIVFSLLLMVAILAFSRCAGPAQKGGETGEDQSIPVEVTPVERGSVSADYSGTTTLEAKDEALVVAKVSGVVRRILVEEGDMVDAGQPLAKLEGEQFRFELNQAEARLAQLTSELKRNEELFASKIVSADAHERIKSDYANQKALFDLAKLRLDYTEIKAPIAGVVAERLIKTGNMVTLNQPVFRVCDLTPLHAVLHAPEKELAKLRPGQAAHITADAVPGQDFTGRILRISPVITGNSGTFKVTVEVRDESRRLKPGMFARVEVVYDVHRDVIIVPKDAILTEDIETSVFVIKEMKEKPAGGKAKTGKVALAETKPAAYLVAVKRKVQLGYINSTHVEIISGLHLGDRVVTTGLGTLKDGARIKIVAK
jgi:membrane fusion protein, multidrug efflux system